MRRRDFIAGVTGTAALPLAARAQQPGVQVIGFLSSNSPGQFSDRVQAFREGLRETGYVEGRNVAIEYRWTDDHARAGPSDEDLKPSKTVPHLSQSGADHPDEARSCQ